MGARPSTLLPSPGTQLARWAGMHHGKARHALVYLEARTSFAQRTSDEADVARCLRMQSPDSLPSAPPERQAPRDVRLPSTDARLAEIVAHPEFRALPPTRRAFADEPAEILAKAVRLSPRDPLARPLVERLHAACARSGLGAPPSLVVLPGGINAFTLTSTMDGRQVVGLHADGLRLLPTESLLFLVGHELGHARADRDGAASHVRARVRDLDASHTLSLLAKSLERRIEVECDRFGYDLSGDAEAASSALVRTATGGLEGSIDLAGVPSFFDPEIDSWSRHLESHPTVPIRVHAVQAYAARGHDALAIARTSTFGPDAQQHYLALLRDRFPAASVHAFTATATPRVRADIAAQLHLRSPRVLLGTFDRPNLCYRVVPRTDRIAQTLTTLGRHRGEASIVYCISRKETEQLATRLVAEGILAKPYHAGLDPTKRRRTQEAFARETIDVVVATVAFGMGIDRSDVRLVLHTSLPKSLEAYQQETGRAGRDGLAAECVLLYSSADVFSWESLVRKSAGESDLDPDEQERLIAGQLEHLHAMRRYAQAARCRHAAISEYFGQAYGAEPCGACDVCLGETESLPDSTVMAQKLISCVARVGERFGVRHVCEVLRGAKTDGIVRHGHERLSTFGLLATIDQRTAENLVHQLLDQGLLARSPGDRPVVLLNALSWEVMRGQRPVVLLEPRAGRAKASKADADDWQGVDRDLFERLRSWRRRVAEARGKPAWTILDDKALRAIARDKPTSPAALLRVKGIGEKRLADFGDAILDLVAGKPA